MNEYEGASPFSAVVIVEANVTDEWRNRVSRWLVDSGCLYVMAWGHSCSAWDDAVDWANLESHDFGDIPEERFVMTTWHENEPIEEVFRFAKHLAQPMSADVGFASTLLLHISNTDRACEYAKRFEAA